MGPEGPQNHGSGLCGPIHEDLTHHGNLERLLEMSFHLFEDGLRYVGDVIVGIGVILEDLDYRPNDGRLLRLSGRLT